MLFSVLVSLVDLRVNQSEDSILSRWSYKPRGDNILMILVIKYSTGARLTLLKRQYFEK